MDLPSPCLPPPAPVPSPSDRRLAATPDARSFSHLTISDFLEALADRTPTPGGGAAAALTVALGTALLQMVVQYMKDPDRGALERLPRLRQRLLELADLDAAAYEALSAALKAPKGTAEAKARRAAAIEARAHDAMLPPLEMAEIATELGEITDRLLPAVRTSLSSDLTAARNFVASGREAALAMVRANLPLVAPADELRKRVASTAGPEAVGPRLPESAP